MPDHIENVINLCQECIITLDKISLVVRDKLITKLKSSQAQSTVSLENEQYLAHGMAWIFTYITSLNQLLKWAKNLQSKGKFGLAETLILQIAFGEYICQLKGGIKMSPNEYIRLNDFGLSKTEENQLESEAIRKLSSVGNSDSAKRDLVHFLADTIGSSTFTDDGLDLENESIKKQFFRFSKEKIIPNAHSWHMKNLLIPMTLIKDLASLGVFGVTIPEIYGGLGLSKTTMCVISEELSRGYIGVGSLATRSDIAAELILCGGTKKQKEDWLPQIATGEILPAAVFTEPNHGSDLGNIKTRAILDKSVYLVSGSKTWITHAARSNMMTLLARTDVKMKGYNGLSMFLAPKSPENMSGAFPGKGITGTEIEVLGYRGMKEYEISFDQFKIDKEHLLGGVEGQGFKQLMETFESARIQTAARAVGVAQNAFDLAIKYSIERKQFGKRLAEFPRVYHKLAQMAVETVIARQLTFFSSREKDSNRRCDLPAGMAKMLSARVAWDNADNSVQIHGGNGFALEYQISRVLCDARVLNIFEGAAEIQAQIIARRILENSNS